MILYDASKAPMCQPLWLWWLLIIAWKNPVADSKKEEQEVCLFVHVSFVEIYLRLPAHLLYLFSITDTAYACYVLTSMSQATRLVMLIFSLSHTIFSSHCLLAVLNNNALPHHSSWQLDTFNWFLSESPILLAKPTISLQLPWKQLCGDSPCAYCAFFIVPGGTAKNTGRGRL